MSNDETIEVEDATASSTIDGPDVVETLDRSESTAASQAVELDPLAAMTLQRDDMRVAAQQIQADFENYKKRVQRDQIALVERANERLLEELLPSLDSFELASGLLESATEADLEKLTKGVALAVGQLRDAVERAGLARIDASGAPFDPEEHEAVMHDDGEGEAVVELVLRTGYRLKTRVLRPAMVKVTRATS